MSLIDIPTQRQGPIRVERRLEEVILAVAEYEIRLSLAEACKLSEALDQVSTAR